MRVCLYLQNLLLGADEGLCLQNMLLGADKGLFLFTEPVARH